MRVFVFSARTVLSKPSLELTPPSPPPPFLRYSAKSDIAAAEAHLAQLPAVDEISPENAAKLAAQGVPRRKAKAAAIASPVQKSSKSLEKSSSPAQAAGEVMPAADEATRVAEQIAADLKRRAATKARMRGRKKARDREKHVAKLKEEGRWTEELQANLNPERWLPASMRTRAGVRGKGRTRKQKFSGGAQGAGDISQADLTKLDAAARAKPKAAEGAAGEEAPRTGGKKKRKKRKKKGRR